MNAIIAFPTNDRTDVVEHFGHCSELAVYYIENNEAVAIDYLTAPEHAPGVLPKFLSDHHVTTIISGGMGSMAVNLFKQNGIEVILGASGPIEENLHAYLQNDLDSTGSACTHDHNH